MKHLVFACAIVLAASGVCGTTPHDPERYEYRSDAAQMILVLNADGTAQYSEAGTRPDHTTYSLQSQSAHWTVCTPMRLPQCAAEGCPCIQLDIVKFSDGTLGPIRQYLRIGSDVREWDKTGLGPTLRRVTQTPPNSALNPSHSAVTVRAYGSTHRAVGRAG